MAYANARQELSLRQWAGLITGLVVFLGIVVGVRMVADHQAEQPIEEPYRLFLQHLADNSSDAEATFNEYRERHQRDTVPSKHFAAVCVVMVRDAKAQGARPEAFSEQMTRGCLQMGRDITEIP
jgi:hypothetical protein